MITERKQLIKHDQGFRDSGVPGFTKEQQLFQKAL